MRLGPDMSITLKLDELQSLKYTIAVFKMSDKVQGSFFSLMSLLAFPFIVLFPFLINSATPTNVNM